MRNHDHERLARAQCHVATRSQLLALGVPSTTITRHCSPRDPWQGPLPRVVVLHNGPPSVAQRYWSALLYARGHGGESVPALITGTAALALYRLRAAPAPEDVRGFDVLVPHDCRVRSHPRVRPLRTRRLPRARRMDHRLPVAPLLRAVVDAVRRGEQAEGALFEVVQARGVTPEALAAELRAERLARRRGVREVLEDLDAGVRSPAEARARRLIEGAGAGVPRPLWNPRLFLDGKHLADPDAYWPAYGVMFEVDSLRHHFAVADHQRTLARHNRVTGAGLMALHVTPGMVREEPERVLADLRELLAGGPYGPWERVEVRRGGY
jgi:hypothetical protein